MGLFDAGKKRRARRAKRRSKRQTARQERRAAKGAAKQQRRQTRREGRFDPAVVLARTKGRQELVGKGLDIAGELAGQALGFDAAQDAYMGDEGGYGDDAYYDDDDEGMDIPMWMIGVGIVALGGVIYAVTKK